MVFVFSPPSLSSSGGGAAHPDRPPPLHRSAAAGQCHSGVSGQRGLPLNLDAGLEGGGQQQLLRGVTQPGGPGEGRPLQLEQHPEPGCRPVEEGGLSELWGQSEWTQPCHSNPGAWPLLRVELQQHFLSGNDAAALIEIFIKLQISSLHVFLQLSQLSLLICILLSNTDPLHILLHLHYFSTLLFSPREKLWKNI